MKRNMHDDNLRNPMKRPTKSKVSSNIDKYEIKQSVTAFFINQYNAIGILPDLKKIKCIQNMPAHKNWEELHPFLCLFYSFHKLQTKLTI